MPDSFAQFFRSATGGHDPYPFQKRFATAEQLPHLVRAPTGSGKTATAILGWLWRWQSRVTATPRRLVYCLPMRVLVEQSEREAKGWIANLKLDIPVHVLMGGVEAEPWHLNPEKPAILIGTQDMLLSRALNRGYAASRFHWPIDFGLLNNDCLWVFDEPQLMANGVSTSAQLAGFRRSLDTFGPCSSVWMSATLEPTWLDTVDFIGRFPGDPFELADEDYDPERPLYRRMTATKTLTKLEAVSSKDMKQVAEEVLKKHDAGTQTLVVVNTVDRAKSAYDSLVKAIKKATDPPPKLLLIHSRFRPAERRQLNESLQAKGEAAANRIIVATQVVEAGVDISARTLVTELAPWASIVQRIGRCNRTDDDGPGRVYWVDLDDEKQGPPYEPSDLSFARDQITKLGEGADVSPKALENFKRKNGITLPFEHSHVIRRRDLFDLFDTAPDLSGNDIDVSRFVRNDDPDTDLQVFWREWAGGPPPDEEPSPGRDELCPVPVGQARDFLKALKEKKRGAGYVWNHLDGAWEKLDPSQVRPGLVILLPTSAGGYEWDADSRRGRGWEPTSTTPVEARRPAVAGNEEATASDPNSAIPTAFTIAQHTEHVIQELAGHSSKSGRDDILTRLADVVPPEWAESLAMAARWHDAGKGHEVFQAGLRRVNPDLGEGQLWAKSGIQGTLRYQRKHFRHELASALAALQHGVPFEVAYLIGAHHGRIRLAIRTFPEEGIPDDPNTLFALGVHDGDTLPEVDLGGDVKSPSISLDLSPMRLGGAGSWSARALDLLGKLGPFKAAYLEALLRAADVRASRKEKAGSYDDA